MEIIPQPSWMKIINFAQISVQSNQLSANASYSFNISLTDSFQLKRNYTGNIKLNYRPQWVVGNSPAASVTIETGGEMKSIEYGSIYSQDPDNDSYKVQIIMPSGGLPQGLIVNVVNLTNLTVKAQSGYYIGGIYTVGIKLIDSKKASSLSQQNLKITVLEDPSKSKLLPPEFQINMGPPFFVGIDQLSDVYMEVGTTLKKILPEIDDPDPQDSWSISIENFASSGLFQFTSFSYPRLSFNPWDSSHAGIYLVTFVLKDNRQQFSRYSFNLIITDPVFTNNSTITEYDGGIDNDTTESIQDLDQNLFQMGNETPNEAKKRVYLPRRVITVKAMLSQELMARISSINSIGQLTIQFNRDVKIPSHYNSFNQSILEITLINKTQNKLRVLNTLETVKVTNNDRKLEYRWGIQSFSARKITLKIDFDDPLQISYETPHHLQVKFLQNGYFVDKFTGKSIGLNFSTTEKLPRQMIPSNSAASFFSKNSEAIKQTVSTVLQANFITNILLSSTLQLLWGMVNALQLIVRLPLLNLKFPANSQLVLSIFLDITNFQFFDYMPLQKAMFNFSSTQPINQQFEDMGYLTVNAIENMGMLFYTLVFILIVYAMIIFIRQLLRIMGSNADSKISKIEEWLRKQLLYNTLIRFFIESYIEIVTSSMIQFYQFSNKTSGDRFSGFLGVFLAILSICIPFFLIYFIRKYHALIKSNDTKLQQISTIFTSLKLSTPSTLYYTSFFMIRRLLFSFNTIFQNYIPMLQVFTLFATSLAALIYLISFKPFDSPLLNRLEIFNELTLYLMSYPCLLFTDISIDDPSSARFKYDMGWVVVGGILFNVSVNILAMIVINFRLVRLALIRRYCLMKKGKQEAKIKQTQQVKELHVISEIEENKEPEKVVKEYNQVLSEEQKFSIKLVEMTQEKSGASSLSSKNNAIQVSEGTMIDKSEWNDVSISENQQMRLTQMKILEIEEEVQEIKPQQTNENTSNNQIIEVKEKTAFSIVKLMRKARYQKQNQKYRIKYEQKQEDQQYSDKNEDQQMSDRNEDPEIQTLPQLQIKRKLEHRVSYDFEKID